MIDEIYRKKNNFHEEGLIQKRKMKQMEYSQLVSRMIWKSNKSSIFLLLFKNESSLRTCLVPIT